MDTDNGPTREMVLLLTAYLSYRALRARRDDLGLPLRSDEAERLGELEWVFGGEAQAGRDPRPLLLPRLHERFPVQLPVLLREDSGHLREALITDLSTSGFFVETSHPRRVGERVTCKFLDVAAAREWQFGGTVVRTQTGERAGMALVFEGIPLEVRIGHPPTSPLQAAA